MAAQNDDPSERSAMSRSPASALRAWARGGHAVEAGVELLLRSFGGRFANHGYPWVRLDDGVAWINWTQLTEDNTAAYSGGERGLLAIAASLGQGDPVDLANAVTALDAIRTDLVLAAVAHAAGVGALHPWPAGR